MDSIKCGRCGEVKEPDQYDKNAGKATGHNSWCKVCMSDHAASQRARKRGELPKNVSIIAGREVVIEREEGSGKWMKGSSGNPLGHRATKNKTEYWEATVKNCPLDDWEIIVQKAVVQAKRGDRYAREWLGNYLVGPAIQRMQLDHTMADERLVEWFGVLFEGQVHSGSKMAQLESEEGDV